MRVQEWEDTNKLLNENENELDVHTRENDKSVNTCNDNLNTT